MVSSEAMYSKVDELSPRSTKSQVFKAGIVLIGGSSLVVWAVMAMSPTNATLYSTSSTQLTSLSALPTSLRKGIRGLPTMTGPSLSSLPGSAKWKELAIAAIEANNRCELDGPKPTPRFTAAFANMRSKDVIMPAAKVQSRVGEVGAFKPLGYFDPWGLSTETTEGQLAYYREAELKHGRICMLASLGIFVAERYHPLFGGDIDVPAVQAATKLGPGFFWPAVLALTGGIELLTSSGRAEDYYDEGDRTDIGRNARELKKGLEPGDIGFDPLGLKNKFSTEDYLKVQERELAHCRLAMIAALGMVLQELAFPDVKLLEPTPTLGGR